MIPADACGIITDFNKRTKISIWVTRNVTVLKKIKLFKERRFSLFVNRIRDSNLIQGDLYAT